ncbi:hypothetical protein OG884_03740 [Streptosporangium sp. NBC_01755]|uniref:hypothetical protein n=1 Tax=unclassified Streptosporangium TaxID=2632669 RepID=UPI002DDB0671|nr:MULTISPECIES: hypothetical protein [unclassified Streptosporangium]WSA27469.1 hypothetical protein OIE13_06220 [Streptosporangium sp. NBC_01810]WSD01061.1 hypothetical protein OG884_03740 [Streptosporangium sp. NBC_01755]
MGRRRAGIRRLLEGVVNEVVGLWLLGVGLALFVLAKRIRGGPIRGWGGLAARMGLGDARSWEITHDEVEPWIASAGVASGLAGLASLSIEESSVLAAVTTLGLGLCGALLVAAAVTGRARLRRPGA